MHLQYILKITDHYRTAAHLINKLCALAGNILDKALTRVKKMDHSFF